MKTRRSMSLGIGIGLTAGVIVGLILLMVKPLCAKSPCEDAARSGHSVIKTLNDIKGAELHSSNLRTFGMVSDLRENETELERMYGRLELQLTEYTQAASKCSSIN